MTDEHDEHLQFACRVHHSGYILNTREWNKSTATRQHILCVSARLHRRSTMLACSGPWACALSLLERRSGLGTDGPTATEVSSECIHEGLR